MRVLVLLLVATTSSGLLAHCQPHDVELADLTAYGDAGGTNPIGTPCRDANDCGAADFCDKPSCAEAFGRCSRRPAFCEPNLAPVCGCDQVTYWNDCLRRQSGVGVSAAGECAQGASCTHTGATECPGTGAKCARVMSGPGACSPELAGTCWVIPEDRCPPPEGSNVVGGTWDECRPPGPGESLRCQSLCDAIRTEKAFHRAFPNCR